MRMGNYLRLWPDLLSVMAATESSFGMRHLTVVPTNFEPPTEGDDEEAEGIDDPAVDSPVGDE